MRRVRLAAMFALLIAGIVLSTAPAAFALAEGPRVGLHFPRLGLMWPDSRSQSTTDIARFDYVVLAPWHVGGVSAYRVVNPDIMMLTSLNACELAVDTSDTPAPGQNAEISRVPNEWIQTQLGSTLTWSVNATETTLRVADTSRFSCGDIVLVDDEMVRVITVGASTISVARGRVPERSPAASHAAGTRVAAAVVFWPGSVVMDMSGYCPRVTVDTTAGPETWAEYNARTAIARVSQGGWDGIFLDRTNAGVYINQVFTRSIDPQRNNVPVADNYAALNTSWNAGLRDFESRVRTGAGDKIILANNGAPNWDLLNGSVLENAPKAAPRWDLARWTSTVFGSGSTSYRSLMESARQPNLTTLETYEVENSPTEGSRPSNPSTSPTWTPNYRKMRFGLATTLMNDGFFTYSIGTFGHAALGILWFDEYDNAGAGRGYLGQPTGSARLAAPPLTTPDLLKGDGSFSSATRLGRWSSGTTAGYTAVAKRSGGAAAVTVKRVSGSVRDATFVHRKIPIRKGQTYTLSFRARASRSLSISGSVLKARGSSTALAFGRVALGTTWKKYTVVQTAKATDSAAVLSFNLGRKSRTVYIDDVKLQSGWRPEVYRRDFQNGIVLVNPELKSATIPLGGTFRKLAGTQAPSVNNGAYVSSVTLSNQDGLILLRTPPLTISGNRTISFGTTATIVGTLRSVEGAALIDSRVVLQSSTDGSTWANVGEATTTVGGVCSFAVRPTANTYYKAHSIGDDDSLHGFSTTTKVSVCATVSTPAAPATMYTTRSKTVYGFMQPRHTPGGSPVRIYKYRYVSGRWKSYGFETAKAYDAGVGVTKYTAAFRLPYRGKWRLRAYHADSAHAASWSRGYDYVTVR